MFPRGWTVSLGMTEQYWQAVSDLADTWRTSTTVREVTGALPGGSAASQSLTGLFESTRAAQGTLHPMRLASEVEYHRLNSSEAEAPVGYGQWLRGAALLEEAFRLQVSWVRSRIPGFPMLRTPHLVDGTAFTTPEYTDQLTWSKQHYLLRLQERSDPPSADLDDEQLDLRAPTLAFVGQLQQADPWAEFVRARSNLRSTDLDAIRGVNAQLRSALRAEPDGATADDAGRSIAFRRRQLAAAVDQLDGRAHAYASAFSSLNALIDLSLDSVLANRAAARPAAAVTPVGDVDESEAGHLRFASASPLSVGDLVTVDGYDELVHVDESEIAAVGDRLGLQYRGSVLAGTADVLHG
jgi:hypothetical protein